MGRSPGAPVGTEESIFPCEPIGSCHHGCPLLAVVLVPEGWGSPLTALTHSGCAHSYAHTCRHSHLSTHAIHTSTNVRAHTHVAWAGSCILCICICRYSCMNIYAPMSTHTHSHTCCSHTCRCMLILSPRRLLQWPHLVAGLGFFFPIFSSSLVFSPRHGVGQGPHRWGPHKSLTPSAV